MKHTSRLICSLLVIGMAFSCTPPPRPAELLSTDDLMHDKVARDMAAKAAPKIFEQAEKYYKLADKAYNEREIEECIHYSLMAALKFSTAMEQAKHIMAEERNTKASQLAANKMRELAQAKKLLAHMEGELAALEKLDMVSKGGGDVYELLAVAESKLHAAEVLNAKEYDLANFKKAQTLIEQCKKALEEKQYKDARNLAKLADKTVSVAISTAKDGYAKSRKNLKLLEMQKELFTQANKIDAQIKQEQRGIVITLHNMFVPGKTQIVQNCIYLLDRIADLAQKFSDYPLMIEAYTDLIGGRTRNLALSQARAQEVMNYLVQVKKVSFERVRAAGYGSAKPIADNSTSSGRAKNRRVEIIFVSR